MTEGELQDRPLRLRPAKVAKACKSSEEVSPLKLRQDPFGEFFVAAASSVPLSELWTRNLTFE